MSTPSTPSTNANIPGGAPLVDQSGQITQVWYQFLLALFNRTGGGGTPTDITGLQASVVALGKEMDAQAIPLARPIVDTKFDGYIPPPVNSAARLSEGQLVQTVSSIAGLRLVQKYKSRMLVSGYYATGDGGGGLYWCDLSDITSTDNGGTIIVATDGGRWKLQHTGPVTLRQFGAKGDGATNDTTAIQNAVNSAEIDLVATAGTYIISSTILISRNFVQLRGVGSYQTIFQSNALAAGGIAIQTGMTGCKVAGLQITKSLGATTVGDGMAMLGTSENITLEDIRVSGFFNGFVLGTTDFGYVRKCVSTMNWKAGFDISNASTYGPVQWQLEDVIAAQNNYHGYYLHSNAGVPGMVMGAWSGIQTYANNGYGFIAVGSAGCPIFDIRLNNFFFGNDNLGSVYLDTKGYNNRMDVGMIEESGRGFSGPTLSTTNGNTAAGVHIGPSEVDFAITNASIFNSSLCGIESFGGDIAISGCNINNSGLNPLAGVGGVVVHAGTAVINGGRNKANIYGIVVDGTGGVVASGGDYRGNPTAVTIGITTTNSKITGCFPLTMNN